MGARQNHPRLRVMSAGRAIELYKEVGRPEAFAERFSLADVQGSHALGHTRMATESRVNDRGLATRSATGLDVCLVHNGSLSNHNRVRLRLRREGIRFQTDTTPRRRPVPRVEAPRGATLEQTLE